MNQHRLPARWPRGLPLPSGWSAPLLSEVAHRESGHTPDKNVAEYWNGGIKWLSLTDCDRLNRVYIGETSKTITDAGIANSSAHLLPSGVVVLSRDAGVGQSAITTRPMAVSQHFLAWECSETIDAHFLYYWFQYLRPELERIAMGSAIKTIGLWYFDRMRVPLPPLRVQRTIAQALLASDSTIICIERLIKAKKAYRRGLVHKLLFGLKRFPQFAGSKWKSGTLGDVLTYSPRKVPKPTSSFLSAGVRSHGKGVFLKKDFPADGIALKELFVLRHLDLVVNITFGWEGAVAIVPPRADGALVSHRFPTYEFDRTKALPEYFRHLVQTRRFVFDVACASPGGAGRNRVLNRKEFLDIQVTLPGLAEQQAIAELLDGLDSEIGILERLQQAVALQKRALLYRLLCGEISVPA